jgi:hypothetical protein
MATGTMILRLSGAPPADGTTGNAFPAISFLTSADADNPKVRYGIAAFDDTTDETINLEIPLPVNYASGGTLKGKYHMVSATTGKVVWRAALQAITGGDATDMTTLDPVNAGGGWASANPTVPGTAKQPQDFSITLNMNSAVAGDLLPMLFQRQPSDGTNDTATGDAVLEVALVLEYTTT